MAGRLYNSRAWRKRAMRQLADEPMCRICASQRRVTAATVADHIEPHRGDSEQFWNGSLQSLCAPCHSGPKQVQDRTGVLRGCDADGTPLDPGHPWREAVP